MANSSNIEQNTFDAINTLATRVIDSDDPADDNDDDDDEHPTAIVTDRRDVAVNQIALDRSLGPSSEPSRKTRKTADSSPPTSPETALFYAGSDRGHDDDATSWDTPQLNALEQSSWTSERDEVTTTNVGQTPYSFHQSPEEDDDKDKENIEVEEVTAASQPVDEPFNERSLIRTLINSIEALSQPFREHTLCLTTQCV
ncbi:hypothetical protein R3I94_004435 [Phoxinus phoxinus]